MNLNINIDIPDEEIKDTIDVVIRSAVKRLVLEKVGSWGAEEVIKKKVAESYTQTVDEVVKQELANSDKLRSKVIDEITAKLRRELNRAIKAEGQT